ncbi:MAG: SURF1 family protein [Alphaproteobacteria bacterium]|nr:SURF1 family protein [Alphaproteobacteria bacterium]
MKFKKPELVPVLFIIAAMFLLCGLGFWQVERLKWKNGVIAQIEKGRAAAAETWDKPPAPNEDVLYHHVKITGTFLYDKRFYVVTQPHDGQQGFSVITPMKLKNGELVLVNRGWSPRDKEMQPKGMQTVEGVVRPPREKGKILASLLPENKPDINLWFYEDTHAMSEIIGKPVPTHFVIEAVGKKIPDIFPIPNNGWISVRNDHLGYAITWFTLAFAGIIMFAIYHRKKD